MTKYMLAEIHKTWIFDISHNFKIYQFTQN